MEMNDLRTAAQQALNYWESASFGDAVMVDKMHALRAALAQQAEPEGSVCARCGAPAFDPLVAQQAEPVSADPHTTTLRNLLECCLSWERDACVLGTVTARQAVAALRAALAQQTLNAPEECEHKADGWYAVQRVAGVTRVWPMTEAQALRAALAQQAEPVEPVATVAARQYDDGTYAGNALDWAGRNCEDDFPVGTKLYTSPPQRKPLTEKDLRKLADKHLFYQLESYEASGVFALSRAVERAHGIKE